LGRFRKDALINLASEADPINLNIDVR